MSNLTLRVLVAIVGIPFIVTIVWMGGWAWTSFLGLLSALGAAELYRLAGAKGIKAYRQIGIPIAASLPILVSLNSYRAVFALIVLTCLGGLLLQLRRGTDGALSVTAITLLGTIYPAALLSWLIPLRQWHVLSEHDGIWLVLNLITGIWMCDTAAYFIGRAVGKRQLAPTISPKKTWEGTIAGALASTLWCSITVPTSLSWGTVWLGAMIGVIIGTVGQIGDLAESLLKRDAHVKDSAAVIPGHGGVLDRFDSLTATAPAVYGLLVFLQKAGLVP